MVWVKVCGVKSKGDVAAAVRAGADAVGLVVANSPRQISPEDARDLAAGASCETVLVTVDATSAEIIDLAGFVGCSGVQLHGRHAAEAATAAEQAGFRVFRPRPVSGTLALDDIPDTQMPMLDSSDPERHGGTGRQFDWSLTEAIGRSFVLAGGLGPDNVAEAVTRVRPWGVDASSGLESSPGVKDHDLIERYVKEAKHR